MAEVHRRTAGLGRDGCTTGWLGRWKTGGAIRTSVAIGGRNAHASSTAKRGAADFVAVRADASPGQPPSRDAQACDSMEVIHLGPNAARRNAPIIMSDPPAVAINPTDIRNPPNAVLGPQGPNPVAKVSANAATPTPKEITPYVAMFFTVLF